MPYGLGFSQSEINARCNKHFRKPSQNSSVKTKLKLAGLKVLKQKKAASIFNTKGGNVSDIIVEEKENDFNYIQSKKETIVQIDNSNGLTEDARPDVIGGKEKRIV